MPSMNPPDDCPYGVDPDEPPLIWRWPTNHLLLHPSRGTADESDAYFFRRLSCFGDDVEVRVSRSGDDLQICCSYQRNFYPSSECSSR